MKAHATARRFDTPALLVGLVIAWQLGSIALGEQALPAPASTVERLHALLTDEGFEKHAWETGRAFLGALAISWFGGVFIGLVLGAHRFSGEVFEPILVALYSIPKVALYPVVLLLFGLGISAKVAFGAMHGIIPVVLFSMNAVRNLPVVLVRAGRAMGLSATARARHILLPACIPEIVSGFRIGFALSLLGTLIGEMFASQRGLGHMLLKAMELNDILTIMALALLLMSFATVGSVLLLRLERRLYHRA
jgi:NitT/TauT family transport system permease protein